MTYKNIILDESILDIDSWLPEKAIDEIVEVIGNIYENPELMKEAENDWKIRSVVKSTKTRTFSW